MYQLETRFARIILRTVNRRPSSSYCMRHSWRIKLGRYAWTSSYTNKSSRNIHLVPERDMHHTQLFSQPSHWNGGHNTKKHTKNDTTLPPRTPHSPSRNGIQNQTTGWDVCTKSNMFVLCVCLLLGFGVPPLPVGLGNGTWRGVFFSVYPWLQCILHVSTLGFLEY